MRNNLTALERAFDLARSGKEKQAKSIESWTAADTAFKANNLDDCNARIGDTGKSMQGEGAGTTTTN